MMRVATFVEGILLAVIIATWIWTWWWNRRVVTHVEDPDYDAAGTVLTMELCAWRARIAHFEPAHALLEIPPAIPLFALRQTIARKVVDAANQQKEGP